MNYEIVELEQFSGRKAKVYSIIPEAEKETLFEKFIDEHIENFKDEIADIIKKLIQIGQHTGARECFFKHEGDSRFVRNYGKFVWALYDEDVKNLRLYCIRFSNVAIILGGGGHKDKSIRKWQDNEKLSEEVRKIMAYAESISKQLSEGKIKWSNDGNELVGNLKKYDNE